PPRPPPRGRRPGGARLSSIGPRFFFAVDPPERAGAARDRALAPLRGCPGEPRWITADRWHLTLLFLGTIPADRLPGLVETAGPAGGTAPPMTLRAGGGGAGWPAAAPRGHGQVGTATPRRWSPGPVGWPTWPGRCGCPSRTGRSDRISPSAA